MIAGSAATVSLRSPPPSCISTIVPGRVAASTRRTMASVPGRSQSRGSTDHITPWQSCYAATQLLGGPRQFVLSTGGHIQSIVNPPGSAGFPLIMLATTPAGDAYTYAEFDRMFRNAGFSATEFHPLPPSPEQVVIAHQ